MGVNADFQPGDTVSFCDENAEVITNDGSGGWVKLTDTLRVYWRWLAAGEAVKLVRRKDEHGGQ